MALSFRDDDYYLPAFLPPSLQDSRHFIRWPTMTSSSASYDCETIFFSLFAHAEFTPAFVSCFTGLLLLLRDLSAVLMITPFCEKRNDTWPQQSEGKLMLKLVSISSCAIFSPLQLGKIGEKIYKVFKFLSNTPWASRERKPKSSPR